ncbi:MAG: plasmid mobilization relaxosome protein MobC [Desulfovibrio sp.]|uniref:plasmid mobilization protein n=1 Tax=Desulfovibrio sp. TaxID=885 RepID=UPI00258EDC4A|nr:plasmid mobilization relaxosome protein MobC [Desulfovibrio sp.]MCD7983440.1 plasmid mobilization relaxosome protein MobC [Desulfovibrio sp.]
MKPGRDTRTAWIKLRVTPAEKAAITAKAEAQGQTVTDFIRQRALDYRLRQTPLEKERVRQLARIGANLNQLARWVNIHKTRAEIINVLAALVSLEQEVRDTPPPPDEDAACT